MGSRNKIDFTEFEDFVYQIDNLLEKARCFFDYEQKTFSKTEFLLNDCYLSITQHLQKFKMYIINKKIAEEQNNEICGTFIDTKYHIHSLFKSLQRLQTLRAEINYAHGGKPLPSDLDRFPELDLESEIEQEILEVRIAKLKEIKGDYERRGF